MRHRLGGALFLGAADCVLDVEAGLGGAGGRTHTHHVGLGCGSHGVPGKAVGAGPGSGPRIDMVTSGDRLGQLVHGAELSEQALQPVT